MNLVEHPPHYTSHPSGIECIQVVEHMPFNTGNAVKYLWRAGLKTEDLRTDLEKAIWYVNRELVRLCGGPASLAAIATEAGPDAATEVMIGQAQHEVVRAAAALVATWREPEPPIIEERHAREAALRGLRDRLCAAVDGLAGVERLADTGSPS